MKDIFRLKNSFPDTRLKCAKLSRVWNPVSTLRICTRAPAMGASTLMMSGLLIWKCMAKPWEKGSQAPLYSPFGHRVRAQRREESPEARRSRSGFESALACIERLQLWRAHPVRKPHHGRRCARYAESLEESQRRMNRSADKLVRTPVFG